MRDLYREVSDRVLAELQQGSAPWIKPWSATAGQNVPHNAVTGRPYTGSNVILLWITATKNGYAAPAWLTYKQAQEAGGNVRKGEHGKKVYFVKQLIVKDKSADAADDDMCKIPMLREYTVFNVAQCEGLPERITNSISKPARNKETRDQEAHEFLTASGAEIREGMGEAYYAPGKDVIFLPAFTAFKNAHSFYGTAFHELGHWTGAEQRLDRKFGKRFGDQAYAAEELVAELASAFLCAEFDFDGELRHAGYIAHWIKLLKDDSHAFFTAASKAQAAADYLRAKALAEPLALAA